VLVLYFSFNFTSLSDVGSLGKVVVSMSVWAVSCLEQWFKVHRDLLQENTSPNSSRLTQLFIKFNYLITRQAEAYIAQLAVT
jgi:hypothetical protein